MKHEISRRTALASALLLLGFAPDAGAQAEPGRPGSVSGAAADSASRAGIAQAGPRASHSVSTPALPAAAPVLEAGKFLGEAAFGSIGSAFGLLAGAIPAALAVAGSCEGDQWVCDEHVAAAAGAALGSAVASGVFARMGNDVFGGRSSLGGSMLGGLVGAAAGAYLGFTLAPDETHGSVLVIYTLTQGALAAAGGRLVEALK